MYKKDNLDFWYKYKFLHVLEDLNSNLKGSFPIDNPDKEEDMITWLKFRIENWEKPNHGIDDILYKCAIELISIYNQKNSIFNVD